MADASDDDGPTCAVCFDGWEVDGDQMPMNLGRCGHALCNGCVRRLKGANGSIICPTCKVVSTAACITKSYDMIKVLKYLRKENASTRIADLQGRVGELIAGKASLQSLHKPLVNLPEGTSLTQSQYYGLLKLMGDYTMKLRSLYRTSLHGTAYGDLLDRVGDKTRLVFIIRKDEYVFGASISAGLRLPDDPTDTNHYKCDVLRFSLAGHFAQPTIIEDIPPRYGHVTVAGREGGVFGERVFIGGFLALGPWMTADIRSCQLLTHRDDVPAGYTGVRDRFDHALLGGSFEFHADEIEILTVVAQ